LTNLVDRLDQVRGRATLRADLDDAFVLSCRRDHRLPFDNVDADRFLDIDVGAGFGRQRSSAVRASDPGWR
jgi:hypothetical protein